jgi:hypothetical protein
MICFNVSLSASYKQILCIAARLLGSQTFVLVLVVVLVLEKVVTLIGRVCSQGLEGSRFRSRPEGLAIFVSALA